MSLRRPRRTARLGKDASPYPQPVPRILGRANPPGEPPLIEILQLYPKWICSREGHRFPPAFAPKSKRCRGLWPCHRTPYQSGCALFWSAVASAARHRFFPAFAPKSKRCRGQGPCRRTPYRPNSAPLWSAVASAARHRFSPAFELKTKAVPRPRALSPHSIPIHRRVQNTQKRRAPEGAACIRQCPRTTARPPGSTARRRPDRHHSG